MPPPKIKEWIENNYKPEVDMTKVPLHFVAEEPNATISFIIDSGTYETSLTGEEGSWTPYVSRALITLENVGDKVYFRAGSDEGNWTCINNMFNIKNKKISANGNIQSLLDRKMEIMGVSDACFSCMFQNCTSLTQAPVLPATELGNECYYSMFENCISLNKAPDLPAIIMKDDCYSYMFYGCTALTQAPALPATTLADNCYTSMFQGCSSLNNVNINFSAWNPSSATYNWLNGVSSTGTFTCPADLPEEFGDSRIPTGWTVVRK